MIVAVTPEGSAVITASVTLPVKPAGRVIVAFVVAELPGVIVRLVGLRLNPSEPYEIGLIITT